MNKYQLAKLVDVCGGIDTRKRVQKVVHLLQASGCPLEVGDYGLHFYGPYSFEVAGLLNELTRAGVLDETQMPNPAGMQYNYKLNEAAQASLTQIEETEKGRQSAGVIEKYKPLLDELVGTELRTLELASTIVYFRQKDKPLKDAVQRTCRLKDVKPDSEALQDAKELARKLVS